MARGRNEPSLLLFDRVYTYTPCVLLLFTGVLSAGCVVCLLLLRLLWHLLALILSPRPGQAVLARTLISIPSTLPLLFFLWPRPRSRKTRSARDRLACSSAHPRRIILSRVWRDFPPHTLFLPLFLLPLFLSLSLFISLSYFLSFFKQREMKRATVGGDRQ